MESFPVVDLVARARDVGVDLAPALAGLRAIYDDVDSRNARNTAELNLPCHRGCDACCHESVFLTRLEFYGAWDWVQHNHAPEQRDRMIREGLRIYAENRELIEALDRPPPPGSNDHFAIAQQLKFRCPLLDKEGVCGVYPMREMLARLFGCSFNAAGGIYGCELVGTHLAGKTVTLLPADATAKRLKTLPLTDRRQVYPFYIHELYG